MLLLLLEPVVLLPCSFCFSSSSCSSCPPWCLVVLVVNVVPPRFSLPWLSSCSSYIFCLSSCWKSSAGRTHTRRRARSRAKLCPHLFDVPICLSCLRRRSTTWSTNSTDRAAERAPSDGANSAPSFFSERRRPPRTGRAAAGRAGGRGRSPPFPGREPGRTHGASYPVSPLKWGAAPRSIALGKKLAP